MSAIEHCQVNDDAAQKAALEGTQEEACGNQAPKGLGEAEKGTHDPPSRDQGGQVNPSADPLDDPVARYVDEDIGDVEDEQSNVELGARLHPQVLRQPVDLCIADVGSVDEGEKPTPDCQLPRNVHVAQHDNLRMSYQIPKRNGITWRSNFRFSLLWIAGSTSTWVCSCFNSSTCVSWGLKISLSDPISGVEAFSGSILRNLTRGIRS